MLDQQSWFCNWYLLSQWWAHMSHNIISSLLGLVLVSSLVGLYQMCLFRPVRRRACFLTHVVRHQSVCFRDLNDRPRGSVLGAYMKHGVLKSIGIVVTTPLICAAYVLRVQVYISAFQYYLYLHAVLMLCWYHSIQSQVVVSETNYLSIFSEGYRRILLSLFSYNTSVHLDLTSILHTHSDNCAH